MRSTWSAKTFPHVALKTVALSRPFKVDVRQLPLFMLVSTSGLCCNTLDFETVSSISSSSTCMCMFLVLVRLPRLDLGNRGRKFWPFSPRNSF